MFTTLLAKYHMFTTLLAELEHSLLLALTGLTTLLFFLGFTRAANSSELEHFFLTEGEMALLVEVL